jgi:glycosyltransferase involved in cell wall biosynthesis
MGRYVVHILELLGGLNFDITLLLFRDCHLDADSSLLRGVNIRFANYSPEKFYVDESSREKETHGFSHYLTRLIAAGHYDVYIDATPFLGPCRLDIINCAVATICYDFIPLRHSGFYLNDPGVRSYYANGLTRVAKSDAVICISTTVAREAQRYLGVETQRISVISPRVEAAYLEKRPPTAGDIACKPYIFAILGAHKSKNPDTSIRIYKQVLAQGSLDVRVNAPTIDQYASLQAAGMPSDVSFTHSISDEEKFRLQSQATVIAHLSLEEGFGIPLLEALFLGRKVIALDIPMNREILGDFGPEAAGAVLFISPHNATLPEDALESLLDRPSNPAFFEEIRRTYCEHWRRSADILDNSLRSALQASCSWKAALQFKIVSSIPGSNCGVADYSVAYARSASGNVIFFFSEGDELNLSTLPNVRAATVNDYQTITQENPDVPCLFNFAFSDALYPGIKMLRKYSSHRDRLLIHERYYTPGLVHFLASENGYDDYLIEVAGDGPDATRVALAHAQASTFNSRNIGANRRVLPADWVARLPVKLISHLPSTVISRMNELSQREPSQTFNHLVEIEDRLNFAPLGIDSRSNPAVFRAAEAIRRRNGLQGDDILVGHFGLILHGIKKLDAVARGVLRAATTLRSERTARRVFFNLVGRTVHQDLMDEIERMFNEAGLDGRLLLANPDLEEDFDAQIASCDLVACMREQQRGQVSHVFVRAVSLGRPVVVNRESGYAYDASTTIDDESIEEGLERVIRASLDHAELERMRARARMYYHNTHRGRDSLHAIIGDAA